MSGLKGKTNNKLFRVKTVDLNEPFKVGVNNVISITDIGENIQKIRYVIDEITYTSFIENIPQQELYSLENLQTEEVAQVIDYKKRTTVEDTNTINNKIGGTNVNQKFKPDVTKGTKNLNKSTKKVKVFNFDINGELVEGTEIGETNNKNTDTIYEINSLSYDQFVDEKIYKEEKYVGLISDPIIESEVFMERDKSSVFERHQRLSEINDIEQLSVYRNGYYKMINTI